MKSRKVSIELPNEVAAKLEKHHLLVRARKDASKLRFNEINPMKLLPDSQHKQNQPGRACIEESAAGVDVKCVGRVLVKRGHASIEPVIAALSYV